MAKRKPDIAKRRLQRERERKIEPDSVRHARELRQRAELREAIARIDGELNLLRRKLGTAGKRMERIMLKAEIAHLRTIKSRLGKRPPRKPPESGVPVPAVPPKGPLPMQGGAEAPMDFGARDTA